MEGSTGVPHVIGTEGRIRQGSDQFDALLEHDLALQHAVNRALRADLHQALALVLGELLRKSTVMRKRVGEPRWAGSYSTSTVTSPTSQPLRLAYISMVIAVQEARLAASSSCGLGPESSPPSSLRLVRHQRVATHLDGVSEAAVLAACGCFHPLPSNSSGSGSSANRAIA